MQDSVAVMVEEVGIMSEDGVCGIHRETVEAFKQGADSLIELGSDMRWLIRIGKWLVSLLGVTLLTTIPLFVTFFVHISELSSKVGKIEILVNALDAHDKVLDKDVTELRATAIENRLIIRENTTVLNSIKNKIKQD